MTETADSPRAWNEADSESFLDTAKLFVPERERQIRIIVERVLGTVGPPRTVVELCSGEGLLSLAFLEADPDLRVIAFDGSEAMRAATRATAAAHGERLETRSFRLEAPDWRDLGAPVSAVVSSLAIHHLDGRGKRRLFDDVLAMLAPGGVFVVADLIEPTDAGGRRILAAQWDEEVVRRSEALLGDRSGLDRFRALDWNLYAPGGDDPMDKPSPLADQLDWLRAAGFARVDLHWCVAGHAIFSGVRPVR